MKNKFSYYVFIKLKLILFFMSGVVSEQFIINNSTEISSHNYIIGIAQIGSQSDKNSLCSHELGEILNSINNREIWALKLKSSFGNVPKSVDWGNYFWFPSRELCDELNDPYKMSLASGLPAIMNVTSPFKMKFTMLYFNFTTPIFVDIKLPFEHTIHVGVCLPESCSTNDIATITTNYFDQNIFEPQKDFNIEMELIETKVPAFHWKYLLNTGVVTFLSLLSLVLLFSLLAEIVLRIRNRRPELHKNIKIDRNSNFEEFILCFDLRDNFTRTLKLDDSKHFIPVIAGLRSIVCLWVTLFHVYYYSLFAISNIPQLFSKLENFNLQPVIQSCFYVDVFFVISAFLLVYNFLSNTFYKDLVKQNSFLENLKLFFKFILHRYVRLMPVLILAMIFSEIFFGMLEMFTPFRMDRFNGANCRETWWYNILLINNFLDLKYICASWSWYLGCEMQFFIFFQLMLFIYIKNENFGKTIFTLSCISFAVISFLCNYSYGLTFQIDISNTTLEALYVKPWVRINPYFGGAFMGWILYKTKGNQKLKFNFASLISFWVLATAIYLTTIFMTYFRNTPSVIVSVIMSFGKLFFGLFVGSLIFVCQQGYGGYFNKFMGSKLFLFLNKFCYSIYMIAPTLIIGIFGMKTEATLFSEVGSFSDLLGVNVLSLVTSFLVVLLWETPFMKISNRFILPKK